MEWCDVCIMEGCEVGWGEFINTRIWLTNTPPWGVTMGVGAWDPG